MQLENEIFNTWKNSVPAFIDSKHETLLKHIAFLRKNNSIIFPDDNLIFNSLNHCKPQNIKVIIIGQDPYHKLGQAHGLAFSVPNNITTPPSLRNFFKEINNDIYFDKPKQFNNDLTRLAKQGVLLLNTILTVEESKPLSHAHIGWQEITHSILSFVEKIGSPLAVMLWGKYAQNFENMFCKSRHLVLKTSHPSPLSANKGFLGCKHFSKCNAWLESNNLLPIVW